MDDTTNTGRAKSNFDSIQANECDSQLDTLFECYRGLYSKVPCSCLVITTAGIILDVNQFACKYLGYSPEELVKNSIFSISKSEDQERLHSALAISKQCLAENVLEEFRLITKNCKTLSTKLTLDILREAGNFSVILVIFEELTEQKRLEELFHESQSQIQLLLDAFPGKVSYVDFQKRYQLISKRYQEWSLVSTEEVLGKTIPEFMSKQQYQEIEEYVELALSGKSIQYEFDVLFRDEEQRYLLVNHVPHFSKSEKVLGFFVFCQDITEQKQAEETLRQFNEELEDRVIERTTELEQALVALREAEEEVRRALLKEQELSEIKSRFFSTTSHEFRTPLTTILSSSQILERYRHKLSEEAQDTHLHRIQSAVRHMTQLLNDLLMLSQAEAGKLEFNPSPLNLEQFCRELVDELQLCVGEQHVIALENHCSSLPAILDAKLLRQILSNLLSNALKYSPQGSTVNF